MVTPDMLEAWIYVQNVLCKEYETEATFDDHIYYKWGERYFTLPMKNDICTQYSDTSSVFTSLPSFSDANAKLKVGVCDPSTNGRYYLGIKSESGDVTAYFLKSEKHFSNNTIIGISGDNKNATPKYYKNVPSLNRGFPTNGKQCQQEPDCVYYKKTRKTSEMNGKCVHKDRLKRFEAGINIVAKEKSDLQYTFLHTQPLRDSDDPHHPSHSGIPYYHIMRCFAGNKQYLLVGFSTGGVENFELLDFIESKYFNSLYERVRNSFVPSFVRTEWPNIEDTKIILCGHSFGCVMALRFGQFVRTKDGINEFSKRYIVVGSSPFKCLKPQEQTDNSKLTNVHIFMCEDTNGIDPFCSAGPEDAQLYYPITILNTDTNTHCTKYNSVSNDSGIGYYERTHDWLSTVFKCLKQYVRGLTPGRKDGTSSGQTSGILQLKKRGMFGDKWSDAQCNYNPSTHEFSWDAEKVDNCWVVDVPNRDGKRQHRFNVEVKHSAKLVAELAAPSDTEKQRWMGAVETKKED